MPSVAGIRMATPVIVPSPGSTPTAVPSTVPSRQ